MKRLLNPLIAFLAIALLAMLAGCAALGLEPADTFNKKLAGGYLAVHASADTATQMLKAGTLKAAEGASIERGLNDAIAALDVARSSAAAGDPAAAQTRLTTALAAVTALQAYLAQKQGAKP